MSAAYSELLIGAGNNTDKKMKVEGMPQEWQRLTTLDHDPGCSPDVVHDLNVLPLPFADDSFDEIHAYEVLEHCGRQGDWKFFFDQFAEFWRILKPNGRICATCPAWDSMWAWGDPGHTRIITRGSLVFLCQEEYRKQVGQTAMADYRNYYRADFDVTGLKMSADGETFAFVLQAIKPSRWTSTKG